MSVTRRSLVVATMAGLTGCAAREQWRAVRLDAEPQATTAVTGGGLIVGTPGPGLMGPAGRIPVRPATTYGREAAWVALTGSTERLAGIGMKRGGGHGNPRWSLFLGSPTALNERPQEFEVFHGWGAGQLIGVAFAGNHPVVVGSWLSAAVGSDIALWIAHGDRWRRLNPAGTPLAATRHCLPQAHAVTGGARLMIVGQAIELTPLRTRAVAWTADQAAGHWRRIDLPSDAARASAHDVATLADGWLVAGRTDERLAVWRIGADLTATPVDVPELLGDGPVRVAAAGDHAVVAVSARGGVSVLMGRPGTWTRTIIPGERVVDAAWGSAPAVITSTDGEHNRLFALS